MSSHLSLKSHWTHWDSSGSTVAKGHHLLVGLLHQTLVHINISVDIHQHWEPMHRRQIPCVSNHTWLIKYSIPFSRARGWIILSKSIFVKLIILGWFLEENHSDISSLEPPIICGQELHISLEKMFSRNSLEALLKDAKEKRYFLEFTIQVWFKPEICSNRQCIAAAYTIPCPRLIILTTSSLLMKMPPSPHMSYRHSCKTKQGR